MTKRKLLIIILVILLISASAFTVWKYQQDQMQNQSSGYVIPIPKSGSPGLLEEEEKGKIKVSDTPEVQALAEKYGGWENVHIKALDIDLVRHTAFIETIYPGLAEETGCIIIAHAGDEGYVYREDKNLNIASQETLAEFVERTKEIDSEYMAKFYLSLH